LHQQIDVAIFLVFNSILDKSGEKISIGVDHLLFNEFIGIVNGMNEELF